MFTSPSDIAAFLEPPRIGPTALFCRALAKRVGSVPQFPPFPSFLVPCFAYPLPALPSSPRTGPTLSPATPNFPHRLYPMREATTLPCSSVLTERSSTTTERRSCTRRIRVGRSQVRYILFSCTQPLVCHQTDTALSRHSRLSRTDRRGLLVHRPPTTDRQIVHRDLHGYQQWDGLHIAVGRV